MRTAEKIMTSIQERHARRLGRDTFTRCKTALIDVTEHQRRHQART
jgi:hypothetical protein